MVALRAPGRPKAAIQQDIMSHILQKKFRMDKKIINRDKYNNKINIYCV